MTTPTLECFPTLANPPQIVPGRPGRPWMDATDRRFAYRCLPMTVANSSGWEILCPVGLTATWTGGREKEDLTVELDEPCDNIAASHFANGILTFVTGWLFRTPPGWAILAGGPPNAPKHGAQALTGLVEADWLAFPFTMNWLLTAPGSVRFEKGEAFCFFSLVELAAQDAVAPVIRSLDEDPEFRAAYVAWSVSRGDFLARQARGDAEVVKQGWQRSYFKGEPVAGEAPGQHVARRRLAAPRRVT